MYMQEHKHRFLVTTGDLTVTETCRCGEVRVRAKIYREYEGTIIKPVVTQKTRRRRRSIRVTRIDTRED